MNKEQVLEAMSQAIEVLELVNDLQYIEANVEIYKLGEAMKTVISIYDAIDVVAQKATMLTVATLTQLTGRQ